MSCFIKKFSNYDFKTLPECCLPWIEGVKSSVYQIGVKISEIVRPHIVNFCTSYREPTTCPSTNCTGCFGEKKVENLTCVNLEKNKVAITAIGALAAAIAIPTIYYIGKKFINCFRSSQTNNQLEIADAIDDTSLAAMPRNQTQILTAKNQFTIKKIPNISKMANSDLQSETIGLKVHFEIEKSNQLKAIINCKDLTFERFEIILRELFILYPNTRHIEFYNLTKNPEFYLNMFKKYPKINSLTFTSCQNLQKAHFTNLHKTNKNIKRFIFNETRIERLHEIEDNCLIQYEENSSNLEEKTNHFKNEVNNLFNPDFQRSRTPSVYDAESDTEPLPPPTIIDDKAIDDFLHSLKTKRYYSIFTSPDLFLDFSEITNLEDRFLIKFFNFLKENDLYVSGIDLSSNEKLSGTFLKHGKNLGIKTLVLSNIKTFDLKYLEYLESYINLKNLDLSYLNLDNNHLKFINNLRNLKILNLNNCKNFSKSFLKTIVIKLGNLEFLSIENTKMEKDEIDEILKNKFLNPLIIMGNHQRNRVLFFKNINSIRKSVFYQLLKIPNQIDRLDFLDNTILYLDDLDKISRIAALEKLKELDLSNVTLKNFSHEILMQEKRQNAFFSQQTLQTSSRSRKKYEKSKLFNNFKFDSLITKTYRLKVVREPNNVARKIEIQTRGNVEDLAFLIRFLKSFKEVKEISFDGSKNINKQLLSEIAKIAEQVKLKSLNLNNTNLKESDFQKVINEKPQDWLGTLIKTVNTLFIENLPKSEGEFDPDNFLAGLNIAHASDGDSKNIRREDISPNTRVEIIFNNDRKKLQRVIILPLPEDTGAGAGAAAK